MTRRCTRCGHRTSDYVTVNGGSFTVYVCREHVAALVPANARYVTVSSGR